MLSCYRRLLVQLPAMAVPFLVVALGCWLVQPAVPPTSKVTQVSYQFVPTAVIDTSSTAVGIADSDLYGMSEDDVADTLDMLKTLGVGRIRCSCRGRMSSSGRGSTTGPTSTR